MKHHSLPSLSEAGLKHFKNLVYDVVKMVGGMEDGCRGDGGGSDGASVCVCVCFFTQFRVLCSIVLCRAVLGRLCPFFVL